MSELPSNVIDNLIQNIRLGEKLDLTNPETRRAVTQALEKLGYCKDTMALLAQRLGLNDGATYKQTRSNFDRPDQK